MRPGDTGQSPAAGSEDGLAGHARSWRRGHVRLGRCWHGLPTGRPPQWIPPGRKPGRAATSTPTPSTFLGLIGAGNGVAVKALRPIGVEPDALRMQVETASAMHRPSRSRWSGPAGPVARRYSTRCCPRHSRPAPPTWARLSPARPVHGEAPASQALVGLGAATWVTGSILKLGGHRAVASWPRTPTRSRPQTRSRSHRHGRGRFRAGGVASSGLGRLAVAAAAAREHAGHHAWASYATLIALTLLVLAWSYATAN